MSVRAGVVVTGTEVLSGRVADGNGPFVAERLAELGVDLAHVLLCGDRPRDLTAQLEFLAADGVDLIITTGGLGPTADDLTLATVAAFCGRQLVLDEALETRIAAIVAPLMARYPDADPDAVRAGTRKQARVPAGAAVVEPVGTAPGVVVPGRPTVVVLPGPPRELAAMWPAAVATAAVRAAIAAGVPLVSRTVRMFGATEAELAATLRDAEGTLDGFDALEITTCLRRGELEVVTRFPPDRAEAYDSLRAVLAARHGDLVFSDDGATVDDQVAALLAGRRIATAESCTGGLVAARLTELAGSSAYVAGAAVAYANDIKVGVLGVDPALIDAHGAVSEPVAAAMAHGALRLFGVDIAVAVTGVAGPGGGTADKPVGTVWFAVATTGAPPHTVEVRLPGGRSDVRDRSTTVAMHLLRRVLSSLDRAGGPASPR